MENLQDIINQQQEQISKLLIELEGLIIEESQGYLKSNLITIDSDVRQLKKFNSEIISHIINLMKFGDDKINPVNKEEFDDVMQVIERGVRNIGRDEAYVKCIVLRLGNKRIIEALIEEDLTLSWQEIKDHIAEKLFDTRSHLSELEQIDKDDIIHIIQNDGSLQVDEIKVSQPVNKNHRSQQHYERQQVNRQVRKNKKNQQFKNKINQQVNWTVRRPKKKKKNKCQDRLSCQT